MKNRLMILSPLLSGILLAVSFPPFKLFLPSFVALIPLLYFIDRESSNLRAALGALFCGLFFWAALLYWVTLFTRTGYLLLIFMMSTNQVIFALVVRRLKRTLRVPLIFSAPLVWTAAEYIHAHGELAFTWGQLAYTLTDYPLWLQMASFTGPYGVSLWLVAVNVLLYELIKRSAGRGGGAAKPAAALAVLIAAPLLFGFYSYSRHELIESEAGQLNVSFVQPSIPQEIKWSPEMRDSTFAVLANLSLAQADREPSLVVWPEAAAPAYLRVDEKYNSYVGQIARELGSFLLTGSPEYRYNEQRGKYDSYNSAFLFSPQGRIIDYYDKIHLVPMSERMPWEHVFSFLREIDVGGSHFIPGTRNVAFSIGEESFSTLICFESIFPELSRESVRLGAQFLVNITNDAWFERTSAAYQHSSFLVLRAIEQRRDIIRAANTGVSGYYDRLGRRRNMTALYETVSATDRIHTYSDNTFYCRHGDWPAHLAWIVSAILLLVSFFPQRLIKFPGNDENSL